MGKITDIKPDKNKRTQVKIYIDDRLPLVLATEVAVKNRLVVGKELTGEQVSVLALADMLKRSLDTAVRFLGYRQRSEAEIREKLQQRGFTADVVDTTISQLKGQGLVNDDAFAQFWKENRSSFSPRSSWLTKRELKQKGVAADVIDRIVSTADDEASAYEAAQYKVRRLHVEEHDVFKQRLGEYLRRRGFNYGIIQQTVEKIWQERKNNLPADSLLKGGKDR